MFSYSVLRSAVEAYKLDRGLQPLEHFSRFFSNEDLQDKIVVVPPDVRGCLMASLPNEISMWPRVIVL